MEQGCPLWALHVAAEARSGLKSEALQDNFLDKKGRKRAAVRDEVLQAGGGELSERRGGVCKQESFQDKVQPRRISPFKSLLINTKLKILPETASWPSPWEIKI